MNTPETPLNTSADQPRRFRRATAIGLTAGLLGGGAAGLMFAVPSLTSAASDTVTLQETSTDTATDTATDTGADDTVVLGDGAQSDVPADAPDPGARIREELQSLVDDGTITAEQADAVAAHLAENMPRGGRGGGMHGGRGFDGTVVADALGITADDLRTALQDGQSIADVATAQGVDIQVVIDALVAEAQTRLADGVTDGRITQEEADAKLADLEARITERVNTAGPMMGDGMGHGPRGGMGGPMGAPDGDDDADATTGA